MPDTQPAPVGARGDRRAVRPTSMGLSQMAERLRTEAIAFLAGMRR